MGRQLWWFFLGGLLLSVGCKPTNTKNKNVFYWNIAAGFSSMDPAFAKSQSNTWLVNQVFNTLIEPNDSLNLKPSLAKSWEISEDGMQYIFHLRTDVFFHDHAAFVGGKGRKMIASDVVFSFNRIMDPKTASTGSWIFFGKVHFDSTTKKYAFLAPNDSTIMIHLEKPFRPFLQLLSLKYCAIVPPEVVNLYGKDFRNHVIGTGPFKLKYYYEGDKIVLHRNPNYFEKDKQGHHLPYLDAVVVSFNPSKQNEFFSFAKGEQSMMSGLDPSFKDNLLTKDGRLRDNFKNHFQFEIFPYLNTEYIGILVDSNLNKGPLKEKKIRQAINYAIDKEKMIRYLKNNTVDPGIYGFVPPFLMPGNKALPDTNNDTNQQGNAIFYNKRSPQPYYPYNPEKARLLLKEANYNPDIAITLSTTSNYLDLAVYMQKELEKVGISLKIENVPGSSLSDLKTKSKTNFFRASWVADYPDPENYFSVFYSKNWSPDGPNYYHYKNKNFDAWYEQSLIEPIETKRAILYQKMQDLIMEEAPVIVLYYDKVIRLKANGMTGLNANPINLIDLRRVKFQK